MIDVFETLDEVRGAWEASVVAIGNFDGMHIGHQAIFEEAVEEAKRRGAKAVALTFEPHPEEFFRPQSSPARLSPPPHKFELMGRYGIDAVVALPFDADFSQHSPQDFVEKILFHGLNARHVVVGRDFRFGHRRAGDVQSLEEIGRPLGMTRNVARWVEWDGEKVSSTRIRQALEAGEMEAAQTMLGRAHRLYGEVVHGEERGRKLGFPTANMEVIEMAIPPVGVYATTFGRAGEKHWRAITNIGHRPTFGGGELTVETFVLEEEVDEELDLYGDEVELDVYRRVRGEKKFESPRELVAQIEKDVAWVREFFEREGYGS